MEKEKDIKKTKKEKEKVKEVKKEEKIEEIKEVEEKKKKTETPKKKKEVEEIKPTKLETEEQNFNFSKIEILFMIVMVTLVIAAGATLFTITTRKQRVINFKNDSSAIVSAAKNAYANFDINNKTQGIVEADDGEGKGMCITINGLKANGFLTLEYPDWDGYVVIEESPTKAFHYTLFATNRRLTIDGYDSEKIKDLTIENGIKKYNNDKFTEKVKTSFTGTYGSKGGTGGESKGTLKRYEKECITGKIE